MDNNIDKDSVIKKIKQKYINTKHQIKERIKWIKTYVSLKYFKTLNRSKIMFNTVMLITIYMIGIISFFTYIGAWEITKTGIALNKNCIQDNFNTFDLIVAQISMTLLVVTVVSLISNLDNKYIYGEKAIEIIFSRKGPLSIKYIFNILFLLVLFNLAIVIKEGDKLLIISIFLLATIIIMYITFQFTNIYTNPEIIKAKLKVLYLEENEKHISKAMPLETNQSITLEKLKDITLSQIQIGNYRYNENIELYFELLEINLFNNKLCIQEYYTEFINHSDFISHIAIVAKKLLILGKYDESINIYIRLYDKLNYHETVTVNNYFANGMLMDYIETVSYIKNKKEVKDFQNKITKSFNNYWKQLYLYTVIDLSYCRLEKAGGGLVFYHTYNDFLEKYYNAIMQNKNLNQQEIEEVLEDLYDRIRMLRLEKKIDWYTISNFRKNQRYNKEQVKYPIYIYGEPIALMILKAIELKNKNSYNLFLKMNLENEVMNFVKIVCLISLVEAIVRGEKKYCLDITTTVSQFNEVIGSLGIKYLNINEEEFDLLYRDILLMYCKSQDKKDNKNHIYYFHPRLSFKKSTIDTVFLWIINQKGISQSDLLEKEAYKEILDLLDSAEIKINEIREGIPKKKRASKKKVKDKNKNKNKNKNRYT